jgi:hypothetical protein
MISEKICLDIISFLYGKQATCTTTFNPGQDDESVVKNTDDNAALPADLYRNFLRLYPIELIDSAIRWLEYGGYLSTTYPSGILSKTYIHVLTNKALAVAQNKAFANEEKEFFYGQEDPYSVFLAHQFRKEDEGLVHYLKEKVLIPEGFSILDGRVDGLDEFRSEILKKIEKSRYFICLLTRKSELTAGTYASSVWLYQETGVAVAFNKKPLLLVENGVDPEYVGELQKIYEYIIFDRNNCYSEFDSISRKLLHNLLANLIPVPKKP